MNGFFLSRLAESPLDYISWVLIIVFSICVHEYAHARAALRYGDDTAARSGHLTLNPLVQMGLQSLLILALIGIAWGAVPIDPSRMRRADRAKVAFAGPAANLLLTIVFSGLALLATRLLGDPEGTGAPYLLARAAQANATLFVLNMLPIPMFDGWSVAESYVPAMENFRLRVGPQLNGILLFVMFLTPLFSFVWLGGDLIAVQAVNLWAHLFGLAG
ncbi:MAG: site-2 protease family protein [Verrucomicrobia bacterium]|nr:site-2 protease family protein [Verrucomicrobiota bacterium]